MTDHVILILLIRLVANRDIDEDGLGVFEVLNMHPFSPFRASMRVVHMIHLKPQIG